MIIVINGTGRATCSKCGCKIEVGKNNQVLFTGYRQSERCHRSCIKDYEEVMAVKQL